jgi:hypothetical protein
VVVLVYLAPVIGLAAIGFALLLLAERRIWRIAGTVIFAAALAWFTVAWLWISRACYDVGEISGCDGLESFLRPAWFVSAVVCVIAVGVGIARLVLRSRRHRVSSSH